MQTQIKRPTEDQPIVHMLIGLPGSGKTTAREKIKERYPDREFVIVSSDDIVEDFAKENGITYSEAWKDQIKGATYKMDCILNEAIDNKKNVIWDQTNLSIKSRKLKLINFPDDYFKVATVVQADHKVIMKRNEDRMKDGRSIPFGILKSMQDQFQFPDTKNEDFDKVEVYQNGKY